VGLPSLDERAQAQGLGRELGTWQPEAANTFTGIAAAPGLVIGTLVLAESHELDVEDHFQGVAHAAHELDLALANAQKQLATLISSAEKQGQAEQANIFKAHLELLRDPSLLRDVTKLVVQGHGPAWAWQQCLHQRIEKQKGLSDATLSARSADLQDVGERVLRHLLGKGNEGSNPSQGWPADAILLADDLAPSVTAQIPSLTVPKTAQNNKEKGKKGKQESRPRPRGLEPVRSLGKPASDNGSRRYCDHLYEAQVPLQFAVVHVLPPTRRRSIRRC